MARSNELRRAIVALHAGKTAVYGTAWKRRGEVLGVLCNIARKVDRIEFSGSSDATTVDESTIDTYVDLLVYCLKYQTFLADSDGGVAGRLGLPESARPFSDGLDGLNFILARLDVEAIDSAVAKDSQDVTPAAFAAAFRSIENCFRGLVPATSATDRLAAVDALASLAVQAIGVLAHEDPQAFDSFVAKHT